MDDTMKEYYQLVNDIERGLSRLTKLGIDVSSQRNLFEEVKNTKVTGGTMALGKVDRGYTAIAKLQAIKEDIDVYDTCYRVYNQCLLVDEEINLDMLESEFLSCISRVIASLCELNDVYDSDLEIIKKIYLLVYRMIKLEIVKTGESQLFLYVKESKKNVNCLSKIIEEDLATVSRNALIDKKIYEINQGGIYSNYLDLDLITLILFQDGKYDLAENVTKRLEVKMEELSRFQRDLKSKISNISNYNWQIADRDMKLKDDRHDLLERGILLGVALSLIALWFPINVRANKKKNTKGYYDATYRIYSTIDGEEITTTDKVYRDNGDGTAEVIVYDEYSGEGSRKYAKYDVSDYEYENPKDYLDHMDIVDVLPETGSQTDKDEINSYLGKYSEVILSNYEYITTELDRASYNRSMLISFIAFILGMLLAQLISLATIKEAPFLDAFNLKKTLKIIFTLSRDKKKLDSVLEKEYEEIKNILDYIDKNEELKQKFKKLYDSNRYLLDDEEELKRRIDKLLADNSYILNSAQKAVDSAKVKQYKKF